MTMYYYDCYNCGRTVRSEEKDDGIDREVRRNNQNCGCENQQQSSESDGWDD